MSIIAISICTLLYLLTGINCGLRGDWPHCIMWVGYCFANLGLLLYELQAN